MKNKKVKVQGLDEENRKRLERMFQEAQEGDVIVPEEDLDIHSQADKKKAVWGLNVLSTTIGLIEKEVEEEGLGYEVAFLAIQKANSDILVGISNGSLLNAMERKGQSKVIQMGTKKCLEYAKEYVE